MKTLYDKIAWFLWDGVEHDYNKYRRICSAIGATLELGVLTLKEAEELAWQITEALLPYTSVDGWLESNGYLENLPCESRNQQVQAYRRRWLKHLCEQYELQATFDRVANHNLNDKALT